MAEPTYKAGIVGLDVIAGHRPGVRRRARGTHLGIAQWPTGRLGGVGTHMFDAMVTGRPVDAVSGWLDEAGKTGCRGDACRDPGGWGMLRLEGGLIVSVDAADYARCRPASASTAPRAVDTPSTSSIGMEKREHGAADYTQGSGMDRAVREIVDWLDDGTPFPYAAGEVVRILEAIRLPRLSSPQRCLGRAAD